MPDAQTPQLAFHNVSFAFDETPVLRNVSFELSSGETLIVLGAAGSGKTVLLKTALGLRRPTQGRVVLFGADVTAGSEREWFDIRSRIGVLFQEGGLFDSLDVADNVAYPLRNQPLRQCPEAIGWNAAPGGHRPRHRHATGVDVVRFAYGGPRSHHGEYHRRLDHQRSRCPQRNYGDGDASIPGRRNTRWFSLRYRRWGAGLDSRSQGGYPDPFSGLARG